jgi:hypothetical protein
MKEEINVITHIINEYAFLLTMLLALFIVFSLYYFLNNHHDKFIKWLTTTNFKILKISQGYDNLDNFFYLIGAKNKNGVYISMFQHNTFLKNRNSLEAYNYEIYNILYRRYDTKDDCKKAYDKLRLEINKLNKKIKTQSKIEVIN